MASYVEISDPAAAVAAGRALSEAGGQLGRESPEMPEVHFGDDRIGMAMQAKYPTATAAMCGVNKARLGRTLHSAGETVATAIEQHRAQDAEDAQDFYGA